MSSTFVFTADFDAEEVWLGIGPQYAGRTGALSQGHFGAKVGVPALLNLLRELEISSTFFIPGRVAERYPQKIEQILQAGHEIGHHGYTHTSPTKLSAAEEEAELARGLEVLRRFGADVRGYRSPSWEVSERTYPLLQRHGFVYSSSRQDDIRAYRHPDGLVELPVSWILDDAPHFWFDSGSDWTKTIRTPAEVRELWWAEFLGIHELGGLTVLTVHPQFIGRPSRMSMLRSFLSDAKSIGGVSFQTAISAAKGFNVSHD